KIHLSGGEARQVTNNGGFEALESYDGKFIYYSKGRGPGAFFRMPVEGGDEVEISQLANAGQWRYWTVHRDGIYFVAAEGNGRWAVRLFNPSTRKTKRVAFLNEPPLVGPPGLSVSPDGRWLLYSQIDRLVSDIVLVDNFH